MLGLLNQWERSFDVMSETVALLKKAGLQDKRWADAVAPVSAVRVHAPIARPPKMFYAAINYPRPDRPPRDDKKDNIVRRPYMFEKTTSAVTGPYDDVRKPHAYNDIDGEVELGVVIGKAGKSIPVERAMEHVAGFMICNDLTVRNFRVPGELPVPGADWLGSKCWDGFAPLGPYLVPRQFVPNCRNLRLTLKVNGETRQDGNTKDMIHSPEAQVAHMSNQLALEPGDVISTGTPNGIGIYTGVFIKSGDLIECEIDGLGVQRNRLIG
jgi:2-keto-4-pentenoate hydratase/2-oxohepta-3-ene-1,7-dioic acid hydratase in catechol pathway